LTRVDRLPDSSKHIASFLEKIGIWDPHYDNPLLYRFPKILCQFEEKHIGMRHLEYPSLQTADWNIFFLYPDRPQTWPEVSSAAQGCRLVTGNFARSLSLM
jgi:hypothetical protein